MSIPGIWFFYFPKLFLSQWYLRVYSGSTLWHMLVAVLNWNVHFLLKLLMMIIIIVISNILMFGGINSVAASMKTY